MGAGYPVSPRAAYFAMKADLKARKQMHGFSRAYNSSMGLAYYPVLVLIIYEFHPPAYLGFSLICLDDSFSTPRMCDSCLAQKGAHAPEALNYKNFTSTSAWQFTRVSHQDYIRMEHHVSAWATLPGWQLDTVMFDLMHNCYLGTACDFLAGGIRCLLACNSFDNLMEVHRDLVNVCHDHGWLDRSTIDQ